MRRIFLGLAAAAVAVAGLVPAAAGSAVDVVVFHGSGCGYCHRAFDYLDQLKAEHPEIAVHEYEVWSDAANRALMYAYGEAYGMVPRGVPTIFIGDTAIGGYRPDEIAAAVDACLADGCPSALGRAAVPQAAPAPDQLIKGSGYAVYYYASDGRRYVFPDLKTYSSWFSGFDGIVTVTDEQLAAIPLGGNVTYRPGIRMVKIQSDPKVYAVGPHGTLRWVRTEALAAALYGSDWSGLVDDVSDALFVNYSVGEPIESVADFRPAHVASAARTINADKGLPSGANPRPADTSVGMAVAAR